MQALLASVSPCRRRKPNAAACPIRLPQQRLGKPQPLPFISDGNRKLSAVTAGIYRITRLGDDDRHAIAPGLGHERHVATIIDPRQPIEQLQWNLSQATHKAVSPGGLGETGDERLKLGRVQRQNRAHRDALPVCDLDDIH